MINILVPKVELLCLTYRSGLSTIFLYNYESILFFMKVLQPFQILLKFIKIKMIGITNHSFCSFHLPCILKTFYVTVYVCGGGGGFSGWVFFLNHYGTRELHFWKFHKCIQYNSNKFTTSIMFFREWNGRKNWNNFLKNYIPFYSLFKKNYFIFFPFYSL
jgi:hypothetical protein